MKKTTNLLTLAACTLALLSQAQISEKRTVSAFDKIQAEGAVEIRYKAADATSLSIEADAAELKNVETFVKNNTLMVKTHGNFKHNVKINITNKNLKELNLTGACSFFTNTEIKSDNFLMVSNGASKIEMPLSAKQVTTNIHGASEISLTGSTQSLNASLEGASNLKAIALKSATTSIVAKGASSATVYATDKLSVDCSGASNVKYKGEPKDLFKRTNEASQIDSVN